jgi:hypothetical protein
LRRHRRKWEDNIKRDLEEVGRVCEDLMEGAQDRDRWRALVSTVMSAIVGQLKIMKNVFCYKMSEYADCPQQVQLIVTHSI